MNDTCRDNITEVFFDGLTDDQTQAVKTLDRDLEIVACAGAGKTKTITLRIINLILNGVRPENIVAITFTRKAAAEMKERIYAAGSEFLGHTEGFAEMFIGTIDSFCFKMLQENILEYAKFSVLDEVQIKIFMERYGNDAGLKDSVIDKAFNLNQYGKYSKKLDIYISTMSILNNCYYDKNYRNRWSDDIKDRLGKYNKCLKDNKYFDYSLLIREMIEQLDPDSDTNKGEMSDFGKKVFGKVKYLIIDEYQDSNSPQEYLAELFHEHAKANLCVVGDADQTIYQFRGSDERNILGFSSKYGSEIKKLDLNFRSTEAVVDIARKSIDNNHADNDHNMKKGGDPEGEPKYEENDTVYEVFREYAEEVDFIAARIKDLRDIGVKLSEIAVLFRQRKKMHYGNEIADLQGILAEKLKQEDIDYIVEGMNNLSESPEYRASKALFDFILSNYYKDEDQDEETVTEQDLCNEWLNLGKERKTPELTEGVNAAVAELCAKKWDKIIFGNQFNMQQIFQDFISHMAFVGSDDEISEKIMYNLGKFSRVIADFELLFFKESAKYKSKRFKDHLEKVANGLYPEGDEDNAYIRPDAVRLMTIHQSKGLEFTAVFIPAFTEAIFSIKSFDPQGKIYSPMDAFEKMGGETWIPNYENYGNSKEADRKLFYVAVTRSKKFLFLTYSKTYGKENNGKTINEYEHGFLEKVKRSDYMKKYNPNRKYSDGHLPGMKSDSEPLVLNFSLLSDYYDCPYRFKLSVFYGFVQPYSPEMGYGRVLHEIMMHLHKAWIEKKKLSHDEIDKIAGEAIYLPFASETQIERSLLGARQCAHAYVAQNEKDADKMIASELDINIELGDGISVNGRIDLVRKIDDDGREKVAIVDLKSAGKDAEQCLNAEQLKIYALGYRQMTGVDADYLMIYNLDAPDGSKNEKEAVSGISLTEVQDGIKKAAVKIRKSELPRVRNDTCNICHVRQLCRRKR